MFFEVYLKTTVFLRLFLQNLEKKHTVMYTWNIPVRECFIF